uniref:Laminin, beta 4 n=2 Tax=Nothobranchius rachovii TaxID=451742 RepID=A0A1A8RJK3_9TELE
MPLASGPLCDRCVAGFWGLGNSVFSCSPCECDIGGAHNNICFPEDGQCHCLPNIVGQRCSDPAHGYFLPSLNYILYEAEHATPMTGGNSIPPRASSSVSPLVNPALPPCEQYFKDQGFNFKISNGKVTLVRRTHVNRLRRQHNMIPLEPGNALQIIPRQRLANKPEKWTGLGFVRVVDGAGLVFTVDNLPASMEYQLVIHYEPESPSDWLATVHIITLLPGDRGCSDNPAGTKALSLPGNSRLSILDSGICLNTGGRYIVEILFQKKTTVGSLHILVDSMGLIPRIDSVQDFCSQRVLDSYHRFDCIGLAAIPGSQDALPKVCEQLIKSLSARIHHGAIACRCNVIGSLRPACSKLGGFCECKPNVIGRCCDTCAPLTFGFGPEGCTRCECDPRGSVSEMCDQVRGSKVFQCDVFLLGGPHRTRVVGVLCDECEDGSWDLSGALECQACRCDPANSISNICDKVTGQCPCHPGFGGRQCDKCGDSYFGNPDLQCMSCDCNLEGSKHPSCNPETGECLCRAGVAGISCDECAPGYESEFPSCKKCHPCTSLWIQNVTNAQKAAQRMKTFISHHGNNQHPPGSHYWQQMLAMYPKLDALTNLTCLSLSKVENMEKLYLQIRKLKDAVDLTPILIDPSPLLHAEIGFLHLEFNKLLTKLKDKLLQEPNEKEKQRLKESDAEIVDEIRQLHQVFIADEKRIRNSNKVTMDSIDTRQEIKLKLSMCRNRGNLAALEQKVKELSEIKLNQKICGAPDLDDCSKCGGGHMCVGVVPHTQKTSKMADNIKEQLAELPSFLQKIMKKITDAQLLAEGFKDQTSDLQYQITNNSMSLETEKIKTKEIIQQIRDYLMDEMVPSEDIVKMAKAVWTIQLPASLVEVRSAIIDILNLNSNVSKYQDHAKELETKSETVQELLKKAHELKKWTKNVDVKDISRDMSATDGAHDKANGNLKAASQARDQSEDQIQDTENKLEHIEKKLMIYSEDLRRGIESVKSKTESSRELAREAKETADSAFNSVNQTNLLDVVMQFELLKQKHLNRTLKVRAAEQLKEILNEAKDVQKQVEDGLQQMHDVEQKIQQLLQRKKQKVVEVAELLEMAELLQQEIASRAEEYTICSS